MDLKNLFETDGDERAVSPVIGVILMVAITVILAAVIGAFVIGIGEDQEVQPSASFNFDFEGDSELTVSHSTGDTITSTETLEVVIDGESEDWSDDLSGSDEVSAGDQVDIDIDNGDFSGLADNSWTGQSVSVVWESETGESSATLSSSTAPET